MDEIRTIITEIEQLVKNGLPDDNFIETNLRECFEKNDNFGILKYYLLLHLKYPKELMYIKIMNWLLNFITKRFQSKQTTTLHTTTSG